MAFKMKKVFLVIAAGVVATVSGLAYAAGGGSSDYKMEHKHWHFNGAFGTYDVPSMQRGYQVYREVCASCHQLQHLSFRHLGDKGAPFYDENYKNPNDNPYVKNFAADWQVEDVDGETGDVIERPGIPADKFPPIYPNPAAAQASNGGALPPDLSLIVAARNGGADYIYNLLVAYEAEPKCLMISRWGLAYIITLYLRVARSLWRPRFLTNWLNMQTERRQRLSKCLRM